MSNSALPMLSILRRKAAIHPSIPFWCVALLVAIASLLGCSTARVASFSAHYAYHPGARLAVVGDLQRTSWLEFWREQNDDERSKIVAHLAAGRPDLLILLGDSVFNGASLSQWADFDTLMTPIRDARIPVVSALGNHDYWLLGRSNLDSFYPRFPLMHNQSWNSFNFGPLGILILDSNQEHMTDAQWDFQIRWYQSQLEAFETDPSVRAVLVFLHHPPYTNSSLTSDETHVQSAFVPALNRATKTRALIAGHVHSYERFERNGKLFIVTGGGGGPRVTLLEGASMRHPDAQFSGPNPRQFHVLWIEAANEGLRFEVSGIEKGQSEFRSIDHFIMPWELIDAASTR